MGKRKTGQGSGGRRVEDFSGSDKPDYAADLFRNERTVKPKAEAAKPAAGTDNQATLKDRLGKGTLDGLARLKAQMAEAEASKRRAEAGASRKVAGERTEAEKSGLNRVKPTGARGDHDGVRTDATEPSFAEMFDPVEPDEDTFADMLQQSKLDWRKFKA